MKRYITSLLAALLLGSAVALAEGPGIEFVVTSHDFGNISEDGDPVSCEFEFTNTGDEPLVIISANASCGCTRPEFPKKPVKPGKTGKIKITYLPKGRPGEFNKTVRVRTNAKRPKAVNLKISGVVIPGSDHD
ncbi:MAG: DUF1573 domain-containing protein [Muribaculaceae bacterium]|nr:DUF1573 domain-containing protein [Muribaculaceae bacterium]